MAWRSRAHYNPSSCLQVCLRCHSWCRGRLLVINRLHVWCWQDGVKGIRAWQDVSKLFLSHDAARAFSSASNHTPQGCLPRLGKVQLSLEVAAEVAAAKGGVCLSRSYRNNHTKLKWRCSEGHEWEATLANVKNSGTWCPHCAGTAPHTIQVARKVLRAKIFMPALAEWKHSWKFSGPPPVPVFLSDLAQPLVENCA